MVRPLPLHPLSLSLSLSLSHARALLLCAPPPPRLSLSLLCSRCPIPSKSAVGKDDRNISGSNGQACFVSATRRILRNLPAFVLLTRCHARAVVQQRLRDRL